jgi:hypothetical protein
MPIHRIGRIVKIEQTATKLSVRSPDPQKRGGYGNLTVVSQTEQAIVTIAPHKTFKMFDPASLSASLIRWAKSDWVIYGVEYKNSRAIVLSLMRSHP